MMIDRLIVRNQAMQNLHGLFPFNAALHAMTPAALQKAGLFRQNMTESWKSYDE
jgi:hypothetical protein